MVDLAVIAARSPHPFLHLEKAQVTYSTFNLLISYLFSKHSNKLMNEIIILLTKITVFYLPHFQIDQAIQ